MKYQQLFLFLYFIFDRELKTEDIINAREFKELCYLIKTRIRWMSLSQHITIMNILTLLEIRKDSTITQVVLKMILHQVNDLTIDQSHFLISKMDLLQNQEIGEETPLFKTLYISLKCIKKLKVLQNIFIYQCIF